MLNIINSSFYDAEENISMIYSSILNYSCTHYLINQFVYFHNPFTADEKTADFKPFSYKMFQCKGSRGG